MPTSILSALGAKVSTKSARPPLKENLISPSAFAVIPITPPALAVMAAAQPPAHLDVLFAGLRNSRVGDHWGFKQRWEPKSQHQRNSSGVRGQKLNPDSQARKLRRPPPSRFKVRTGCSWEKSLPSVPERRAIWTVHVRIRRTIM